MIGFALFVAAGAGSIGAASFESPFTPGALLLHHGQDDPEHVEKDLIQEKLIGAMRRPVDVAGLAEPVEVLRNHWGPSTIYARNENLLFFVQGYTAARDRLFQLSLDLLLSLFARHL